MSTHLIVSRNELLLPWAAKKIEHIGTVENFGPAEAMGIATGPSKTDRLLAVVVYHLFQPEYRSCMISIAATSPRWCTRNTVRAILRVPFYQFNCNRVWTAVPHMAKRTCELNKKLGFTREGALRDGFGPGTHAIAYGMLRREFEWMYEHGKKQPKTAANA